MYYLRFVISEEKSKWLGDDWRRTDFNSPFMKGYKTLRGIRAAASRCINKGIDYGNEIEICEIDFSKSNCPVKTAEKINGSVESIKE